MESLIYRSGAEVVQHLLTVAASLDSLVVGESQILGQVKEAYEMACRLGATGPLTHTSFKRQAMWQNVSHAKPKSIIDA